MSSEALRKCFDYIVREVRENPGMSEDELYSVLDRSGFFECLGYERFGVEVRKQFVIVGERKKADYVCLDEYQNVIFVIEAKKPREKKLEEALGQLWERYVLPLKARYGVLTNGRRFIVYKRLIGAGYDKVIDVELEKVSRADCEHVYNLLRKPEYEITYLPKVREYFESVETLSLKEPLAKEYFFETFKLNVDSVFGALVKNLVELFNWIHPRSKFLKGAYGFWRRSLAREPEKIPDSWKPFLKNDKDVFKFMFCLETAHALLARLILAKACEDLKFPGINISKFTMEKIHQVREQIPVLGYPIVLIRLLKEMRDQLIYSLFEEDIFSWWSDAFVRFIDKSSVELLQEKANGTLENFSRSIARVIFVLYKFDFSEIAGDPLGDLYQQYFDRETRKALGEFYTPVEVVDYILDAVEYKNVRYKRLLDPACGSGTFLVEALKRYLKEAEPIAKKYGWAHVLRELCNSPKIVGLDIHPFACLIAQVRFMLELIPYYRKALEEEKFEVYESLQRLPIFRTDSLLIEMKPIEFQEIPRLMVTEEDIKFKITLPSRISGDRLFFVDVTLPSWQKTASGTEYNLLNLDEYFCVIQGIFDAVKEMINVEAEEVPEKGLEAHIRKYFKYITNRDFPLIAKFFKPYADRFLKQIYQLRLEFENGRLIKAIEDSVLAALLKNYVKYDFVVGNPPYVRVHRIPKESKLYYSEEYFSATGIYDLYVLFLERGIKWLNKGGKLGFIISNKFMQSNYGKRIRKFIGKNCVIEQIIDFGDSGVFSDVTNYPCILIVESTARRRKAFLKYVAVHSKKNDIITYIRDKIKRKEYYDNYISIFEVPIENLGEEPWRFASPKERVVLEKIERGTIRLSKIAKIKLGLFTALDEAFIVDAKTARKENLETSLLRPLIRGKDVRKWRITWNNIFIIYPYLNGVSVNLGDFPKIKQHLLRYKKKLMNRAFFKNKRKIARWFEYPDPGNPALFEDIKIVVPDISKTNNFALDTKKYYCLKTCYVIKPFRFSDIDIYFLLGLLNSKVVEFYFKHISPFISGGYYRYMARYLERIPIKIPKTRKEKDLAEKIRKKVELLLELSNPEKIIGNFHDNYLRKYLTSDIEFDEIKIVLNSDHDKLEPILSGDPNKGYIIYPDEGEDPIFLETYEKARYLTLILKNRTVRKGEVIRILLPRDNNIVVRVLEDFNKKIEKLGKISLSQIEKEIDELAYQLYGLNEGDRVIVEDFLKKF